MGILQYGYMDNRLFRLGNFGKGSAFAFGRGLLRENSDKSVGAVISKAQGD